ncbi:Hypothetical_protein [Hexamita inflata]|uniref:Hypothetical_protein n=1 Tax=Hexamita inflata TaxID=28002 RepID=A0AA86U6S3_9EUKA|nr:Hypothetical protein HINF_LOCUS30899 [Hexamita inflata]
MYHTIVANLNTFRIQYFLAYYALLCILQTQYVYQQQIFQFHARIINLAIKSTRSFCALWFIFQMTQCQNQQNRKFNVKQLRNQMINVEFLFQLLFNVPNNFQRAYGAIIDQHFSCIFGYFGAYSSSSLQELIIFVTKYNIFYIILVYQYHESLKFALIGALTSIFMIVHYYHTNNKKQPQIQALLIQKLQTGLENMFQKHFQQQIGEVNIIEKYQSVVGSIRINLQSTLENTVLFSRLFEQACLQYKFQIFEASSNSITFGANTAKSKHQQLDECVQMCYIAELIAKQLNMITSAGISSGTIQYTKYMFGNNQLIMQQGDSLQKSDLLTKYSFDETLVDINEFYRQQTKISIIKIMSEPGFVFNPNEQLIQNQNTMVKCIKIQTKEQIIQQIDKHFGTLNQEVKIENFQDISESDKDSRTISNDYKSWPTSLPTSPTKHSCSLCGIQEYYQTIHQTTNEDYLLNYQTIKYQNPFSLVFKYIQRISSISIKLNNLIKQKKQFKSYYQHLSMCKNYIISFIHSVSIFFAYCGNVEMTYERIENQFAIQLFSKIQPVKNLILIIKIILTFDFCFKALSIVIVFFTLQNNSTKHKLKRYYIQIDQIIEKTTFIVSVLSYVINQFNHEAVLNQLNEYLETKFQYNHIVIRYAIAHAALIVMFSSINFTMMLDVTLQSPFTISSKIKIFLTLETVHCVALLQYNKWYSLMFILSQLSQVPWLLYQFQISINNIGQQINSAEYVKKQKTILSRRRKTLDVECELLMLSENQPILISEIIGDQTVIYRQIDINPIVNDKQVNQLIYNKVQSTDNTQRFPIIQMENSYIFRLDWSYESVEEINYILNDVYQLFEDKTGYNITMINIKQTSSKWICFSTEIISMHLITAKLLSLLQKHNKIGIVLSGGDLKVIPLCYNDVHCDVIGEAADEIEELESVQSKILVSKQFWEKVLKEKQTIKCQKQYSRLGTLVELW